MHWLLQLGRLEWMEQLHFETRKRLLHTRNSISGMQYRYNMQRLTVKDMLKLPVGQLGLLLRRH